MKEDEIISVLIGLVGACNNNPKTANTDSLVIKSLAFPLLFPNFGDDELSELLEEIRLEKFAVAPGCAECTTPCGNTSDYDMNRIYQAEDDIRVVKLKILSKLRKMAVREYSRIQENSQTNIEIFYKAVSYISYDLEKNTLLELLRELDIYDNGKENENGQKNH
ncbi:MAG: hypothetical protein HDT43_07885 [Ruminococcaceae bacterium]|nr:hypothetical protein [Oscillospiraceae bacterium]